MDAIGLPACFRTDPRPTCLLDLDADGPGPLSRIVFQNEALQKSTHLLDDLLYDTRSTGRRAWTHDRSFVGPVSADKGPPPHTYIIEDRWRVVQWSVVPTRKPIGASALESALADRDSATRKLENLHKMMEIVNVGIFEYDQKGKLVWGNDAFYRLSGHAIDSPKEELTWEDSIFPEDHNWLLEQWTQMASGVPVTLEMRWKRPTTSMPDGQEDIDGQWVVATCVPTFDHAGNVSSVSGCLTDIATQKQSEFAASKKQTEALERLHASERKFSNFAELANVGIWMIDLDKQLQYCNREWFAISGHPSAPYKDVDWTICLDEANQVAMDRHLEEITRTKKPAQFQLELLRPWKNDHGDEMRACVIAGAFPELDESGSVTGFAGTLTDITHLRWAERIQKQRTDDAIEAKRQQENFIDMTCHEIRNPLGAVVHSTDLARSSVADIHAETKTMVSDSSSLERIDALFASTFESLKVIVSCCTHQKRIVDDILTLSKLDSKLLTIALTSVRLDGLLSEVSSMFEADAQKAGVTLRLVREPLLDEIASTQNLVLDSGRLLQVLINLVSNSLKFTQKEIERNVTIVVGASREAPTEHKLGVKFIPVDVSRDMLIDDINWAGGETVYLYFKIIDTGCGFDSDEESRIFNRFEQADVRTYSKYGGSGLGLFISREMVEMQGGEIGVYSQAGSGATFAFYITTRTTQAPTGELRNDTDLSTKSRAASDRKYSILIVEDNVVNQKVLRLQLQKLGHDVHIVSNGREALTFLETTSCWTGNPTSGIQLSIILMDMEMPVMDGIECARTIRQAQANGTINRHIPIISVSANARDAYVNHALECGMDDAISKPFRVADLIPMINSLVPE